MKEIFVMSSDKFYDQTKAIIAFNDYLVIFGQKDNRSYIGIAQCQHHRNSRRHLYISYHFFYCKRVPKHFCNYVYNTICFYNQNVLTHYDINLRRRTFAKDLNIDGLIKLIEG